VRVTYQNILRLSRPLGKGQAKIQLNSFSTFKRYRNKVMHTQGKHWITEHIYILMTGTCSR